MTTPAEDLLATMLLNEQAIEDVRRRRRQYDGQAVIRSESTRLRAQADFLDELAALERQREELSSEARNLVGHLI